LSLGYGELGATGGARCDAIAKLGTPVIRVNELDERFAASRSLGRIGSVGENSDEGIP
jgi:hypothetical protein